MKKVLLIMFLVCGLLSLVCGLVFAQEATMLQINGKVYVLEQGQTDWTKAFNGQVINEGDKIKTESGASAFISFDEEKKNVIRVEPKTEMELQDTAPIVIELPKGTIMSKIGELEKGSSFQIRTPTAVAGVAGTGFMTLYDPKKQKFEVHVYENEVVVSIPEENVKAQRGVAYAAQADYMIGQGNKGIFVNGVFSQGALSWFEKNRWNNFLEQLKNLLRGPGDKVGQQIEKGQEKNQERLLERKNIEQKIQEEPKTPHRQGTGDSIGI